MNRSFAIGLLAFALAVFLGITLFGASGEQRADTVKLGPVLPALTAGVNDVSSITVSDVEGSITLVRAQGTWQFKALPGIPVNQGKVREFLLDLAQAQVIEAKTSNASFHSALGLGAAGTRIDLGTAGALTLGKEGAGGGRFVRRGDEDQTYLAKGVTVPEGTQKAWASLTLPVARKGLVTRVQVDDGAAPYAVSVSGEVQTLEDLGDGEALAYDGVLDTVVAGAVFLDYDSIRPSGEIAWGDAGKTVFFGEEAGDTLTYDVAEVEGQLWLRAAPKGAFVPDSDIDWASWAFEISDYRKQTLLKPRSELLLAKAAP